MQRRSRLTPVVAAAFLFAVSGFLDQVIDGQSVEGLSTRRPPVTNPTTNRSYAAVPHSGVLVRDMMSGQIIATIPVPPRAVQVVVDPITNLMAVGTQTDVPSGTPVPPFSIFS